MISKIYAQTIERESKLSAFQEAIATFKREGPDNFIHAIKAKMWQYESLLALRPLKYDFASKEVVLHEDLTFNKKEENES